MENSIEVWYLIIGGCIAFIVKVLYDWIKNSKTANGNGNGTSKAKETIAYLKHEVGCVKDDVIWLKDIHNVRDEDGKPVWYVSGDLKKIMIEVKTQNIETNVILKLMLKQLERNGDILEKVVN